MSSLHQGLGRHTSGVPAQTTKSVPDYLARVYRWAYLSPRWARLLDRHLIVQAILWGNADRLMDAAAREFGAGQTVLQPACVYGSFSRRLLKRLGPGGWLDIRDVSSLQLLLTRAKLAGFDNADIHWADAAIPPAQDYDGVCCFFLLHEVPDDYKVRIVRSLLGAVRPGGKAVFVDYHRMARFHPLRPVMAAVFGLLEPFAKALTEIEIADLAEDLDEFAIEKKTYFGGLYQKVVFRRRSEDEMLADQAGNGGDHHSRVVGVY